MCDASFDGMWVLLMRRFQRDELLETTPFALIGVEKEWGGVELTLFGSKHVENGGVVLKPPRSHQNTSKMGGIETTLFASIHVEGGWAGVGTTPFVLTRVENGWGGVETTRSRRPDIFVSNKYNII